MYCMNNEEATKHLRKQNNRMYKAYPNDEVVSPGLLESLREEMRLIGVSENEISINLQKILPSLQLGLWDIKNNYPSLLPYKEYILPAYDGIETIASYKKYFVKGKFDFKLYDFELDRLLQVPGPELKIAILVDRMGYNADFKGLFSGLSVDYNEMVIPQNRICQILFSEDPAVKEIRESLKMDSYWVNFLTSGADSSKGDNNLFLARFVKNNQGLCFDLDEFTRDKVWIGGYQTRYIVAQP